MTIERPVSGLTQALQLSREAQQERYDVFRSVKMKPKPLPVITDHLRALAAKVRAAFRPSAEDVAVCRRTLNLARA